MGLRKDEPTPHQDSGRGHAPAPAAVTSPAPSSQPVGSFLPVPTHRPPLLEEEVQRQTQRISGHHQA